MLLDNASQTFPLTRLFNHLSHIPFSTCIQQVSDPRRILCAYGYVDATPKWKKHIKNFLDL